MADLKVYSSFHDNICKEWIKMREPTAKPSHIPPH